MRTRQEIEKDAALRMPGNLLLEVLLDLRDQNAQLLAVLTAQVENERDAMLASAGIQSGS